MNFEKQPNKKSKWKGRVAFCLVLIIAAGALAYFREPLSNRITKVFASTEKDPVPVTKLERQPFSLTVSAEGEIIGLEAVSVNTPNTASGQLKIAWLIPEGTFVRAGDPVVRFDNTDILLNLEQRQNSLETRERDIAKTTRQQVTDAKNRAIDLRLAEEDYNYSVRTMAQDETLYSRWEIITAAADERYNRANLEIQKGKARTAQRADRSKQQVLAIDRDKELTEVSRYESTLGALEVTAQVDGMVLYYRDRREEPQVGNSTSPGQTILEIINLDALQARINVLERDGGYLAKGLPVHIHLDAVPSKVFNGVIRNVSSVSQSLMRSSPLRYFNCDVTIVDAGRDLKLIRPGMYLRGDIVLHEYDSVFVVPSGAVTYRDLQKDSVVFVKNGDRFDTRVVETGMSSYGEAIIVKGVDEGDLIALVNPEGTRKLSLPDFNASSTTTMPKGKMMMPPGGMGGMGGMMPPMGGMGGMGGGFGGGMGGGFGGGGRR